MVSLILSVFSVLMLSTLILLALLWILGLQTQIRSLLRLLLLVLVLLFVVGICQSTCFLSMKKQTVFSAGGDAGFWLLLILFLIAFIRFINHRRQFKKWLPEKPMSLKRRVERE